MIMICGRFCDALTLPKPTNFNQEKEIQALIEKNVEKNSKSGKMLFLYETGTIVECVSMSHRVYMIQRKANSSSAGGRDEN
jgi:predicted nucleic-acid-binding protein